jgi:hypothetical protein
LNAAVRPSALAEAIYRREIGPWALLGLTLGLVEGATAAVLVKRDFVGVVSPLMLNLAVALVSGAPAMSNVISFVWANVAHGRERVRLMTQLQAAFALAVGLVSLAPRGAGGLVLSVVAVLIARSIWSGVLTVRAAMWTASYPRNVLARITGRIVVVSYLAVAVSAGLVGWALEKSGFDPRWVYGGGALAGLVAAWLYRETRVRRQFRLLAEETAGSGGGRGVFSLRMLREILAEDPSFREYMFWMGLFGAGNLVLIAQLVVIFAEQLRLSSGVQIGLLSVVPMLALPLFTPWWARLFDGSHVVAYRARQGWALVIATMIMCLATFTGWLPLLWFGAIVLGSANAGANLGWNLGHNDFASIGRAQHYMGVHVTLTGVRGAIAPPLGVLFYEALEALRAGAGRYALVLPLALTTVGAIGFNLMRRDLRK